MKKAEFKGITQGDQKDDLFRFGLLGNCLVCRGDNLSLFSFCAGANVTLLALFVSLPLVTMWVFVKRETVLFFNSFTFKHQVKTLLE